MHLDKTLNYDCANKLSH